MSVETARGGFEGSYLGANDRISPQAIMECKICWTSYDPAEGDEYRQVLPGTPFAALPADWKCPGCDAPKEQFIVREDPGSDEMRIAAEIERRCARLVADFREVFNAKMRDVPIINQALHVEALAFRPWQGGFLGVLIAPWFMNLIWLPGEDQDWSALKAGEKEVVAFPSGEYEFIHNSREMTGPYKACSLFSPMADFTSQLQAVEVARAVMVELFKPENRDGTDRAAEIRAAREAELAPPPEAASEAGPASDAPIPDPRPTRRALLTGGLAAAPAEGDDPEISGGVE
ncbi:MULTISPECIES: [NiFe]-hydrogenase assembly chaperone HybE [Paracoccus]|uniref:[NiFe]-hydrogenase assembly chaperone HybE n=1 Tax=Paracoccus TaxID=265 RepID=UPI00258F451D|nr:[NiFe]-hydrogenase assembly chaperone HybE [Paracoccus sp. (in: a-proteobacteria)]WGR59240.1 [NiFe]-hydrogenase assembly chaperone HybE [Paracoccus ferrooxidans]